MSLQGLFGSEPRYVDRLAREAGKNAAKSEKSQVTALLGLDRKTVRKYLEPAQACAGRILGHGLDLWLYRRHARWSCSFL